jgi:heme oxygenase
MSVNLANKLREGTKEVHTIVEDVGFLKCFLKGVVERNSYRKLLANFYFIYSTMEEEIERHRQHSILSNLYFPELHRKEALKQDLLFYYGSNWKQQITLSPVGKTYIQRIQTLSNTEPELLVGYFYTRYLGDLSGGQILKKIAQRSMNLVDGEGLAFYEFPAISNISSFKANYRKSLNKLPIDDAMADHIVKAANEAFDMNIKIYQELQGSLVKAIGQILFNSLTWENVTARQKLVD